MLFHSLDFILFFAVCVALYFRAPPWLRGPAVLVGLAYPVLAYAGSPQSIAAALFCAGAVTAFEIFAARGRLALARKLLLTAASLLFYSAWRWPFTSLLLFSTVLDYNCAKAIHKSTSHARRRLFLLLSLGGNLGLLGFFKYTNFLLENIENLFGITGLTVELGPLPIILPLGISFYTFQTLSYTIDVYRGRLAPRESLLDVALFVSFFPQLVAGPILRAADFFPQLGKPIAWDSKRAISGLLLMIWGMSKKLLIADFLAPFVNQAYAQPELYSGAALLFATYAFAFQIYCDFSGYSDLAIGAARILGFHVPENFRRPYFATSITTFWRRWHISLSSWLRDYLYISLGGNRGTRRRTLINLMATMLLGGLWHGASWNFVIWGGLHGGVLAAHKLAMWVTGKKEAVDDKPGPLWLFEALLTFHFVCLTWVFFRAETLVQSVSVVGRVLTWQPGVGLPWLVPAVLMAFLLVVQALETRMSLQAWLMRHPRLCRFVIYGSVLLLIGVITSSRSVDFIYFVF